MSNIKQQKSILAKLLATENISVEHRKSMTAYFDPKARVMVLPVWKEMSSNLYDLLLGHETGHALYTPAAGWHDAVLDKSRKGFKTYLNVIEDVRIEKMIQSKYPGLKASFTKGYTELMDKDFFGTKEYDIQSLPLIDRINLHYKVGSFLNLKFTETEQKILDRIDNVKTWDDVTKMSTELYDARKAEVSKNLSDLMKDFEYDIDDDFEDDFDEDWDDSEYEEDEDAADGIKKRKNYSYSHNRGDLEKERDDPESITDKAFRRNEKKLVDDSVKPYHYVNCPTANLKNIIVPFKKLKAHHGVFKLADYLTADKATEKIEFAKTKLYKEFLDVNNKYISYLIKEFEMRRNARQFARASISKTGELDVKKAFSYQINEDLFKRMTVVPNGKSHGLVMFIDYSGSMTDNISATIEQTLILAMFCRKVNIPFRVYAFSDQHNNASDTAKYYDYNLSQYEEYLSHSYYGGTRNKKIREHFAKFSSNNNELDLTRSTGFKLKEYLSSEMTGVEFRNAAKYWLLVGRLYARNSWRYNRNRSYDVYLEGLNVSSYEALNGTPLNETIVASMEIVKTFKEKYRLDVVNTVFLTDGDSNETHDKLNETGASHRIAPYGEKDCNIVIKDAETGKEGLSKPGQQLTIGLLKLLKSKLNCNVIGFYLTEDSSGKRVINNKAISHGVSNIDLDSAAKEYRKNKFFMLNDIGYDDYYIVPGGDDLSVTEDKLEVSENASKNEFKRAFMKMQKSKNVNRVLLNRFISKIS